MKMIKIEPNESTVLIKVYEYDDPIWKLDEEKQKRKAIADIQKELSILADSLVQERVVERG